jgi:hypothetical protein
MSAAFNQSLGSTVPIRVGAQLAHIRVAHEKMNQIAVSRQAANMNGSLPLDRSIVFKQAVEKTGLKLCRTITAGRWHQKHASRLTGTIEAEHIGCIAI